MPSTLPSQIDYRTLFEGLPDLYLVLEPADPFRILDASTAYLRATKTERHTILGRGIFEVFPDDPDDPEANGTRNLRASLERAVQSRRPDTMAVQKYAITRTESEGGGFEERHWSPVNTPCVDNEGVVTWIIHRVQDVTEFMRVRSEHVELVGRTGAMEADIVLRGQQIQTANARLSAAYEALAAAERARTVFFNEASHELRTPLTLILGSLEIALEASPDDARLQMAHRNGDRLLRLVNSLLDFSRLDAGEPVGVDRLVDLTELTAETCQAFEDVFRRAGVDLYVDLGAVPLPVRIDPLRWEQCVNNLLSNALKHTFAGSVRVRLRPVDGNVELTVADTGVGIPAGHIDKIFERFYRVRDMRSRTHEGFGIGLALVHSVAHAHGGQVRVASEPGAGSTFTLTIPHEAPDAIVPASLPVSSAPPLEAGWLDVAGVHDDRVGLPVVLWVDDNADMRVHVRTILRPHYRVVEAADGVDALALAADSPPDLILSDVMMPRLDGIGLVRAVRAHPRLAHVPVILVSARAGEHPTIEALDAEADDYIVKPFAARELLARVRTHLHLSAQRLAWGMELERINDELRLRNLELLDARAHAEAANQSKSEFLTVMSHELRTPLNAIIGFSEVLADGRFGDLNDRQRRYLAHVLDGGRHLLTLINDLLDLSKIEAGRMEISLRPCSLRPLCVETVAQLQPLALKKNLNLTVENTEHASWVRADPLRVRQMLYNLISNAVKFTPEHGQVHVVVTRSADGARLRATVHDSGPGIRTEELHRLFQSYTQLENAQVDPRGGTGLGLAVTQRLAQLMGGTVGVTSVLGAGSQFWFELPSERGDTAEGAGLCVPGRPLALLVDDDSNDRELLRLSLEDHGFYVHEVANGEDGLIYARAQQPDLILLDVYLPGIDGWEVQRALRGDRSTEDIPVILVTVSEDREKALRLGAIEHVVKPVDRTTLDHALLRARRTEAG